MKLITCISLFLFSGFGMLKAQDTLTQSSFASSYAQEKAENYAGAINAIKRFYSDSSYEMNVRFGYLHYLAGKHKEAVTYYTRAIGLKPYAIEPKFGFTLPAGELSMWEDITKQYKDILKIEPRNSYFNYKLGYMYYMQKKYSEALTHFKITSDLYPFDYSSVLMTGWVHYRLGNLKEAKSYFLRTLIISPFDKSATEGLSMIK